MLEVINVDTFYGESQILWDVSLKVEPGQAVAVLGRNGMGKTTLVRSIMGLTPARRGKIRFNNKEIMRLRPYQIGQMGMALVPQGRRIFPSLSVRENLVFGMRGKGFSENDMYSYFPVLKARADQKGNHLSGGEQQMLAMARALLSNPQLVLMDEPSEGLAPIIIKQIGDIIRGAKKRRFFHSTNRAKCAAGSKDMRLCLHFAGGQDCPSVPHGGAGWKYATAIRVHRRVEE